MFIYLCMFDANEKTGTSSNTRTHATFAATAGKPFDTAKHSTHTKRKNIPAPPNTSSNPTLNFICSSLQASPVLPSEAQTKQASHHAPIRQHMNQKRPHPTHVQPPFMHHTPYKDYETYHDYTTRCPNAWDNCT